jgi:aminoglycoside phosphotransferase (APT) family kinase protein
MAAHGTLAAVRMTASPAESRQREGVRVACAVALDLGLACDDPSVLTERSNLLVHLRPAPVVARVATRIGPMRPGKESLAREVAITRHLAHAGAPVVPPSGEIDPGPHERDGLALTFFEYAPDNGSQSDADATGRALRACHEALARYGGALPRLRMLREAEEFLARVEHDRALAHDEVDLLGRTAARVSRDLERLAPPLVPVHGDAHLRNVISTARGPLWNDWEDTHLAPLEWDLACLVFTARVHGSEVERASRALAAHGGSPSGELLDLLVDARAFQSTIWAALFARERPELRAHIEASLRFLREHA